MDYKNKLLSLIKEANLVPQYKRLPRFFRFLLVISMLPVICFDFCLIIGYFILAFIHKGLSTPFDILYDFVHKERKDARDFSDAAICLATMPGLFIFKALLAIFSFVFYIHWFAIMCATYIATLGGIRWQPYILEATFDDNLNGLEPAPSVKGAKIFTILNFVLFIFAYIASPICYLLAVFGFALSATGFGAIIGIPLIILFLIVSLISIPARIIYLLMNLVINPLIFKLKSVTENNAKLNTKVNAEAKRDAEKHAKRDAEEHAKLEAEERAKLEAEEHAKLEAEERAKREAEERAKLEAEERAKREAEERAKREAEERAKLEAEERAKLEAEERAKREAEERAKREAEERAKLEAEESSENISKALKNDFLFVQRLKYALQLPTDDDMIRYLHNIQNETVRDILNEYPDQMIREQIKQLLNDL